MKKKLLMLASCAFGLLVLPSMVLADVSILNKTGFLSEADGQLTGRRNYETHKVYLLKGKTYTINMSRTSGALDPYLYLKDDRLKTLRLDDDSGVGTNARIVYRPLRSGNYYVYTTAFNSDKDVGGYRLTITRPAGVVVPPPPPPTSITIVNKTGFLSETDGQLTGNRNFERHKVYLLKGKRYTVNMVRTSGKLDPYLYIKNSGFKTLYTNDDGGVGTNSRIYFTPSSSGSYYIYTTAYNSAKDVGGYRLTITRPRAPIVLTKTILNKTGFLSAADGQLAGGRNYERHSVYLIRNKTYTINMVRTGTQLDPYLYLKDSGFKTIFTNDDGGVGLNSRIVFRPSRSGTYYIYATGLSGTRDTGGYRLTITRPN